MDEAGTEQSLHMKHIRAKEPVGLFAQADETVDKVQSILGAACLICSLHRVPLQ